MAELFFAQLREDTQVERTLLTRERPTRIACIASGGCGALSLLDDTVEAVVAIDLSPAQCALVELRRAAIAALDRDGYLGFIGEREDTRRPATYATLRASLPKYAESYWDAHPERVAEGIQHAGVTERFYRFLGDNLQKAVLPAALWRELLALRDPTQQALFFATHCDNAAFRMALRVLLSRTTHLTFYPGYMFARASEHQFGDFFLSQFAAELAHNAVYDNYLLHQLLLGHYLLERPLAAPYYLQPEAYSTVQRNLHKLTIVPATLVDALRQRDGFDALFLSNVFDWLDGDAREQTAQAILRAARKGAQVVTRHMLASAELPTTLERALTAPRQPLDLGALERSMLYRAVRHGRVA
jgi:S-adenosylmethionine:diacylglycerol 3-amino-3-carboxypropyl transferase